LEGLSELVVLLLLRRDYRVDVLDVDDEVANLLAPRVAHLHLLHETVL
jgi:hypothetical protein